MDNTEPQLIYFLLETELMRLKIGISERAVGPRVRGFQTGNSQQLRLLGVIPWTPADERAVHRRFASRRLRGGWFQADGATLAEVLAIVAERGVVAVAGGTNR